ncbi:hypothetical protein QNM97_10325 [Gordonia sp. L191]|uniref:hypothetical protein n=1 Tax=Gordonia sp. L191 TaxID=2982699 RepID=UPI0024C0CE5A|nr:hypothetical protein [Gordonia sp. L191]WHU49329.1 hypothetical protein QNM97_10325 [Gordonia sp. L191]
MSATTPAVLSSKWLWPSIHTASCALSNCDTEGNYPPSRFRLAVPASRLHLLRVTRPLFRITALRRLVLRAGYQHAEAIPR